MRKAHYGRSYQERCPFGRLFRLLPNLGFRQLGLLANERGHFVRQLLKQLAERSVAPVAVGLDGHHGCFRLGISGSEECRSAG